MQYIYKRKKKAVINCVFPLIISINMIKIKFIHLIHVYVTGYGPNKYIHNKWIGNPSHITFIHFFHFFSMFM